MDSNWMFENISNYVKPEDINLRHGWFELKISGIIEKVNDELKAEMMDKIESIIAENYFIEREKFNRGLITYDDFLSNTFRYTDTFQILRNLRSKYQLPISEILN